MSYLHIVRHELWRTLASTLVARGLAASGALLLGIVLGRFYGAEGLGLFALSQAFLFGAGILCRFGMDNALMRYVGMHHHGMHVFTYLLWAAKRSLAAALLMAVGVWALRNVLGDVLDKPALGAMLVGIAIAIPALTLTYLLSGFMKGVHRPATACLLESGYISLVTGIILLSSQAISGQTHVTDAGWAIAAATWLVFFQGAFQVARLHRAARQAKAMPPKAMPPKAMPPGEKSRANDTVDLKGFLGSSRAFFVTSLAELMQNVLSVIIVGFLLTGHDLGLFKSAERLALLIGFILMVIASIFPPRFAALYYRDEKVAMKRLARQSMLLGGVLASPLLLACIILPERLLALFGEEFVAASPYLRILAVAQTVNVATAAVSFLLNMTGHEALMRNIALFSAFTGLLCFMTATYWLGALGATWSLALLLILQNTIALFFVRKKLGFWVYPAIS